MGFALAASVLITLTILVIVAARWLVIGVWRLDMFLWHAVRS